jgi:hypothetical protein
MSRARREMSFCTRRTKAIAVRGSLRICVQFGDLRRDRHSPPRCAILARQGQAKGRRRKARPKSGTPGNIKMRSTCSHTERQATVQKPGVLASSSFPRMPLLTSTAGSYHRCGLPAATRLRKVRSCRPTCLAPAIESFFWFRNR